MKLKSTVNDPRSRDSVLERFLKGGPVPRGDLAGQTALSPATVIRVTQNLIDERVLREREGEARGVGRPSPLLELNPGFASVLGVSLSMSQVRAVITDLHGEVLSEISQPLDTRQGQAGILDALRLTLKQILKGRSKRGPRLAQAVVAMPGPFDHARGLSTSYPRISDWADVPIRSLVEDWTKLPVDLAGYMHAMALAEQISEQGQASDHLLCVEIEENISMGAIVGGEVLSGFSGNAGELGHITIEPEGPRCYCGNRGCLEKLVSCKAVEEEVNENASFVDATRGSKRVSFQDVVALAQDGHPFAVRLLRDKARLLGTGLAAAVNLFNPEKLILGGRFFEAGAYVLEPLRETLNARAVTNSAQRLTIARSSLNHRASALGAARSAVGRLIKTL